MSYSIIGGGLAGSVLAKLLPGSTVYEKNKLMGLCADNEDYQDFIHVLHTNNKLVWDFVNKYTVVTPHKTILGAYVNGEIKPYPPKELTDEVFNTQYTGYSKKMWKRDIPPEAKSRIVTSPDGYMFHTKYEGIPYFATLTQNLLNESKVVFKQVKDGDLDGKIILTGAIDEYFNYCYGKLPYRGMRSTHYKSEVRLDADFITFSDEKIPFQRLVDYKRLGYGDYIGVESACDDTHYPIRDEESEKIYNAYKTLAERKGVLLCGRLATYHYIDMDQTIEQCFKLVEDL